MPTLAERAVRARKAAGLTSAEASRRIGIKQPSLWAIEHGNTKTLKGQTLLKMAHVYGVSEKWLGEGAGTMKASPEKQAEQLHKDAEKIAADWVKLPPEMRETIASSLADMLHLATKLRIIQGVADEQVAKHIDPAPSADPAANQPKKKI